MLLVQSNVVINALVGVFRMLTFGTVSLITNATRAILGFILHTLKRVSTVIAGDSSKEHRSHLYAHMRSVGYGASLTELIFVVNAGIVPATLL